jgi:hypothetical protein
VRIAVVLCVLLASSTARAVEPWIDPDPAEPPSRLEIGSIGIAPEAEYRAQFTFVNPISLNTEDQRRYNVIEHRGRFGASVDYQELVKLTVSVDVLDSVLWGDNGTFGGDPSSDSGLQVTTRDPNVAEPCIVYLAGDTADPHSYGWGLCEADVLKIRHLYAQVNTPIGALRVGRQPVGIGMAVQTADGTGRTNRFGVSDEGDRVDRIMFATKPLEVLKSPEDRDTSERQGLIVALIYDRWASDSVRIFGDDVHQFAYAFRWVEPQAGDFTDLELQAFHAYRWNPDFETFVHTVGGRAAARYDGLAAGFDIAGNIGSTREVSTAYSVVTNDPIVDQTIRQLGARAVVRYDWFLHDDDPLPMLTGYLEGDYASGDGDPEPRTTLSQFRFAEDTNVGLLLFDHIVRFQSARASAAGTEVIRALGAQTFPSERVNTRGAFTDAVAIFPQIDFRPHQTVLIRGGVLVAWVPDGLVDPVASLQAKDGATIEDDLVNFVGGKPGTFYGVEIDGRAQWRFLDHFALDLEMAGLFPGDALEDINGTAVKSWLTNIRTTFYY